MAFNKLQPASGPFFLRAGASTQVRMWFSTSVLDLGQDQGAIWIMADPVNEGRTVILQVNDFQKILGMEIADDKIETPFIQYAVTVTNVGPVDCHFTIQGGGNV
jgi:hypothetical protein